MARGRALPLPSSLGEECLHGVQRRVGLNPHLIEILRLPGPSHGDVEHQPSTLRDLPHPGTEMEHGSPVAIMRARARAGHELPINSNSQ